MRRLGVVDNIAYDGSLVVRAGFAPAREASVVDRRKRALGRVARVFGPVAEPFVSVRPQAPPGLSVIGTEVFVEEVDHARKEDRES